MRRVTVQDFKGKTLVSIREYYTKDDGKLLPGKKVSFSVLTPLFSLSSPVRTVMLMVFDRASRSRSNNTTPSSPPSLSSSPSSRRGEIRQ